MWILNENITAQIADDGLEFTEKDTGKTTWVDIGCVWHLLNINGIVNGPDEDIDGTEYDPTSDA